MKVYVARDGATDIWREFASLSEAEALCAKVNAVRGDTDDPLTVTVWDRDGDIDTFQHLPGGTA